MKHAILLLTLVLPSLAGCVTESVPEAPGPLTPGDYWVYEHRSPRDGRLVSTTMLVVVESADGSVHLMNWKKTTEPYQPEYEEQWQTMWLDEHGNVTGYNNYDINGTLAGRAVYDAPCSRHASIHEPMEGEVVTCTAFRQSFYDQRFIGGQKFTSLMSHYNSTFQGTEAIDVPAGTFDARVHATNQSGSFGSSPVVFAWSRTIWWSDQACGVVRDTSTDDGPGGGASLIAYRCGEASFGEPPVPVESFHLPPGGPGLMPVVGLCRPPAASAGLGPVHVAPFNITCLGDVILSHIDPQWFTGLDVVLSWEGNQLAGVNEVHLLAGDRQASGTEPGISIGFDEVPEGDFPVRVRVDGASIFEGFLVEFRMRPGSEVAAWIQDGP